MGKSLVIVESPAKAKTINKYLGKDFVVKSSVGHVRDLPTSGSGKSTVDPAERAKQAALTRKMAPEEKARYKKEKARTALIGRMGVDPEHGWEANYQVLEEKYQQVEDSKKASVDQAAQRQAALSAEVEEKISAAVAERDQVHQAEVEQLKAQITKLESSNKTLKAQVSEKAKLLTEADDKNMKLNAQADIQATVLERSREVFQREVKVKQELAALQSER